MGVFRDIMPFDSFRGGRNDCRTNTANRFIWSNVLSQLKFIDYDQKYFYTTTFRLTPEVFIRKYHFFIRLLLGTVSSRCAKKRIVRMRLAYRARVDRGNHGNICIIL